MLQVFLFFLVFSVIEVKPQIKLVLTKTVLKQGESFEAVFSGENVTDEMSFDVYYREPGDDYDRLHHWQDGPEMSHNIAEARPGIWRITGVEMHKTGTQCPFYNQNFQPLDVSITVLWPISSKIELFLAILFAIYVLLNVRRWFRETK